MEAQRQIWLGVDLSLPLCSGAQSCATSASAPFVSTTAQDVEKDFRRTLTKRFNGWEEAVKAASEVLIDEMRTLLEHRP